MGRRRRGQRVDGWIVLDKHAGITSTAAVTQVRRFFDAAKAGHGGTLDPLATGLLPIAMGEATKTVAYVMAGLKTYRFTLKFGEARATDQFGHVVLGGVGTLLVIGIWAWIFPELRNADQITS